MSLTLDKLKALRRQAGASNATPQPAAPAPVDAVVGQTVVHSLDAVEMPRITNPGSSADTHLQSTAAAVGTSATTATSRPSHAGVSALAHAASRPVGRTPLHAKPAPSSALDWINQTIRHADPATLAARAHGKPVSLRRVAAAPAPAGPAAPPVLPAVPVPARPASALDWINSHIRHADPAALTGQSTRPTNIATPTTAPTSTTIPVPGPSGPALSHASPAAAVITPRSVGDLQRLLATRQRAQSATANSTPPESFRRDLPGEEIAPGLWLSQAHVAIPIPDGTLPLDFAKRPEESVDPHDLLFFDTETTGLAGGTGTRAFMIGVADFHDDPLHGPGLRVRQLLIATLGAETAMLDAFASWLVPSTVLASFNGRSYDAPLLKTRYRLARRREPLTALDHIDLLHPSRRRWKGRWENCRLGTIERQVLGIERKDDLPGSQAPAAWLDFLRGGSSARLHRVATHNHQDVVTLAQLFHHLSQDHERGTSDKPGDAQPAPTCATL